MQTPATLDPLQIRDLGRLGYVAALDIQRRLNQQLVDGQGRPTLLLVEHDPVITVTPRQGVADHLLADRERLGELGIDVQPTDRGGDITYHGPGQLVAYPILRLAPLGLNLGRYMRLLEQVVIETVAGFGVEGLREAGATGVWVRCPSERAHFAAEAGRADAAVSAKLCAMGVRIRKNTTLHGLALNVAPDLSHFDTIVPCGLAGRPVTSLHRLLGERCPTMDQAKARLATVFTDHLEALAAEPAA